MGNAKKGKMSKQEISDLYNYLRSLDKSEWEVDSAQLGKVVKQALTTLQGDDKSVGAASRVACRVATSTNLEEFAEFIENGELPPIKLTTEEMNALRGGFFGAIIGAVGAGVSAVRGRRAAKFEQKVAGISADLMSKDEKWQKAQADYGSGKMGAADFKAQMELSSMMADQTARSQASS